MRTIRGDAVPLAMPRDGMIRVLCVGEAPGPRGADKSGIPFFGDRAGQPLYRALVAAGACVLPSAVAELPWDGQAFADAALNPVLTGVALTNAYDVCPTANGTSFRAPSRAELVSEHNQLRLRNEMDLAVSRGLRMVLALGAVATRTVTDLLGPRPRTPTAWDAVEVVGLPHPSAQGLLSAAPDRGRGARLADLATAWERDVAERVRAALAEQA